MLRTVRAFPANGAAMAGVGLAPGASVIEYISRTDHSETLVVEVRVMMLTTLISPRARPS